MPKGKSKFQIGRPYKNSYYISQEKLAKIAGVCTATMRTSCKLLWKVQRQIEKEEREKAKKPTD